MALQRWRKRSVTLPLYLGTLAITVGNLCFYFLAPESLKLFWLLSCKSIHVWWPMQVFVFRQAVAIHTSFLTHLCAFHSHGMSRCHNCLPGGNSSASMCTCSWCCSLPWIVIQILHFDLSAYSTFAPYWFNYQQYCCYKIRDLPLFLCYRYCKGSKKNTPKVKILEDETKLFSSCLYIFNDIQFVLM